MKFIDTSVIYLRKIGISQRDDYKRNKLIGYAYSGISVMCLTFMISATWFFIYSANTFEEHLRSFFVGTYSMLNLFWHVYLFCYCDDYMLLFTDLTDAVKRSK